MDDLERDIQTAREMVERAWSTGNWVAWLAGSCVLMGFRLAHWAGVRR